MKKKVIELIRVSTEEQAKDYKSGIQRQETVNKQTVERFDLERLSSICIKDVSGTEVCRCPEIQKLIDLMATKSIDGVVVSDLDRLIRPDNYDDYSLLQRFKESGTLIYTHDQVLDLTLNLDF